MKFTTTIYVAINFKLVKIIYKSIFKISFYSEVNEELKNHLNAIMGANTHGHGKARFPSFQGKSHVVGVEIQL